jgi:hypothetical protein
LMMANDESTFVTSRRHSFAKNGIAHMRDRRRVYT